MNFQDGGKGEDCKLHTLILPEETSLIGWCDKAHDLRFQNHGFQWV